MMKPPAEPLCLKVNEAARMIGVGRTKLYELIASGDVEAVKLGKSSTTPMRWSKRRAVSGISSHIGDSASTTQALSTLSTGFLPMR